jgi:hypothetical protein
MFATYWHVGQRAHHRYVKGFLGDAGEVNLALSVPGRPCPPSLYVVIVRGQSRKACRCAFLPYRTLSDYPPLASTLHFSLCLPTYSGRGCCKASHHYQPHQLHAVRTRPVTSMTGDTTLPSSTGPSSANTAESRKARVHSSKVKQPLSRSHHLLWANNLQRQRDSTVSLLTAVDSKNIIDITGDTDEQPSVGTGATSSATPSKRLLRTRTAKQSKLAYDLKYHPIDDSLRPVQAAKRRSAHGGELLYSDAPNDASSVFADTDAESVAFVEDDIEEEDKNHARSTMKNKNKKRSRLQSQSPQPTRRSLRRTEDRNVSYRMDIHPQDEQLEVSSDDGENYEIEVSNNAEDEFSAARIKRAKLHTTLSNMVATASHDERNTHTLEQHTHVAVQWVKCHCGRRRGPPRLLQRPP